MEISPADDLAVRCGSQILQGERASLLKGKKDFQDGGLLIGNRELVVVSIDKGSETIPIKVIDHGVQQKEATRRLFDAHVFAQSFQQEVEDKNTYIETLRTQIKQLEEQLIGCGASRIPLDRTNDLKELRVKNGAAAKVPQWLRNDPHSREIVAHFTNEILAEGEVTRKPLSDQLWLVVQATVHRWAESPNPLVLIQAKAAEKRSREVMSKSLRESSELRSHLKEVERKFQELWRQYNQAQRELLTRPPLSNRSGRGKQEEGTAVAGTSAPHARTGLGNNPHSPNSNGMTERSSLGNANVNTSGGNRGSTSNGVTQSSPSSNQMNTNGNSGNTVGGAVLGGPSSSKTDTGGNRGKSSRGTVQGSPPPGGRNTGNNRAAPNQVSTSGGNKGNSTGVAIEGSRSSSQTNTSGDNRSGNTGGTMQGSRSSNQVGTYGTSPGNNRTGSGAGNQASQQNIPSTSQSTTGGAKTGQTNRASKSNAKRGSGSPGGNTAYSSEGSSDFGEDDNSPSPYCSRGKRQRNKRVSILSWGGDYHDVDMDHQKWETMDNEVFEPLSHFDDDMKELLIDIVDEKVKRILMLDPDKFEGRLPFGLRPQESEDEVIKKLKEENSDLKSSNFALEEDLKRMREMIEKLRKSAAMAEKKIEEKGVVDSPVARVQETVSVEPFPVTREPGKEWTDADVQAAIADALAKASEEHRKQVAQLQDLLNKANADLEAALQDVKVANKRIAELQAQLDASLKELEKLKKELARLQNLPQKDVGDSRTPDKVEPTKGKEQVGEKVLQKEKVVEKVTEKVVKQIDREAAVSLHRMQAMMQLLLQRVDGLANCQTASKCSNAIDAIIGKTEDHSFKDIAGGARDKPFRSEEDTKSHHKLVDDFANWCQDLTASMSEYKVPVQRHTSSVDLGVQVKADEESTARPDQQAEIDQLKNKVREQQEEISRLLLMIDELRRRLAQMQQLLQEKGGLVAEELEKALEKVGLKDLVEAREQSSLKNVYERLYQDALQRMQRLALTLEQKAEASKMYYDSVASAKRESGLTPHPESLPLQRLTEAALLGIHGMFYHYDILFRRVCERAAADGLKNAAIDNYRLALADIFGELPIDPNYNALNSLCIAPGGESVQNDRIQRRGTPKPRNCSSAGALTAILGPANVQHYKSKSKQGGFVSEQQNEPGAFQAYMAKMQQAAITTDPCQPAKMRPISRSDNLGALTQSTKRSQLSSSLSLPALPKGFASMKVVGADLIGSLPNSAASHKTSLAGLASHESSLMLQDSWMSSEC